MKKNGFTLVELIATIALVAVILIFLFNIVFLLKDLYVKNNDRTELLVRQSLLSRRINEEFVPDNLHSVTSCGEMCYSFEFNDGVTSQLSIDLTNKKVTYDDFVYKLEDSSFFGEVNVYVESVTLVDVTMEDSILIIDIPIYDSKYSNVNFGIKLIYAFNSNIIDFSI